MQIVIGDSWLNQKRVWLDELPDATYPIAEWVEYAIPAESTGIAARSGAVEWYLVLGPRPMYGFIGGTFQPDTSDQIKIRVGLQGKANGNPIHWALASNQESSVFTGLPNRTIEEIQQGLLGVDGSLGAGTLTINQAVHAQVSSVPIMYRWLAGILVRLFALPDKDIDERIVIELFDSVRTDMNEI
jgi:hypothetical protein